MKKLTLKLVSATALIALTGAAMANSVTLMNATHHKMKLAYKLAYKNPGEPTLYSAVRHANITHRAKTINVPMRGYRFAGVVPVSVNGHHLPRKVTVLGKPEKCSLATNRQHQSGSLLLKFHPEKKGHGKITCARQGGVTI